MTDFVLCEKRECRNTSYTFPPCEDTDPVRSDFICSGCVGDGTRLVPVADVEKPGTIGSTDLARLWVEVES